MSNTLTVAEAKRELRALNIEFPPLANKAFLLALLNNARQGTTPGMAHIPSTVGANNGTIQTPAPTLPPSHQPDLPIIGGLEEKQAAVERAYALGVLNAEERTAEHKRLLGMGPRTPPTQPRELLVSETGERKREFMAERERLVGTYDKPRPSPELITFIRSFHKIIPYIGCIANARAHAMRVRRSNPGLATPVRIRMRDIPAAPSDPRSVAPRAPTRLSPVSRNNGRL